MSTPCIEAVMCSPAIANFTGSSRDKIPITKHTKKLIRVTKHKVNIATFSMVLSMPQKYLIPVLYVNFFTIFGCECFLYSNVLALYSNVFIYKEFYPTLKYYNNQGFQIPDNKLVYKVISRFKPCFKKMFARRKELEETRTWRKITFTG